VSAAEPPLRSRWGQGSGARAGDLYRRLLALIFLVAWISLGCQVRLLIGARGLMPIGDFVEAIRARGHVSFIDFPTVLWWFHGDAALVAGTVAGGLLAIAALAGLRPRLCFALSTALYLSYATASRTFLSFQWDNLLLECGLLASFLPPRRASPLTHFLFRVVLFKLYFESGIAKWQSPIHDWHDGSAMTVYYETAPLPTWLGWWAHNLPAAWHRFESRAVLALELVVPFAIFGPRRLRLAAAALFTAFQILNIATANYGFFCYLALALHVFLLDDADIERAARALVRLARILPARLQRALERRRNASAGVPAAARPSSKAARAGAAVFITVSLLQGLFELTEPSGILSVFDRVLQVDQSLRLINTYHLFQAITRERIEPEFQTSAGGGETPVWTAHVLRHKPGEPARAPDFVAPHQPRVDFQLWFYGLAFERREPSYVAMMVERLCNDPGAVAPLFAAPLPEHPDAVRIVYWRYHFTTHAERRATGAWWRRESIGATRAVPCDR
jgi:hypothetical protein